MNDSSGHARPTRHPKARAMAVAVAAFFITACQTHPKAPDETQTQESPWTVPALTRSPNAQADRERGDFVLQSLRTPPPAPSSSGLSCKASAVFKHCPSK